MVCKCYWIVLYTACYSSCACYNI